MAGLKEKDVITKLIYNNKSINLTSANTLIEETKKSAGKKIKLFVQRNQQQLTIDLVPRVNPP